MGKCGWSGTFVFSGGIKTKTKKKQMNCPSVRCRNIGSGYVKPSSGEKEFNNLIAARLAERAAQDAAIQRLVAHPTTHPSGAPETKHGDTAFSSNTSQLSGTHIVSVPKSA